MKNKIESLETRLTYFSDRDDDIWKMTEGLSQKIQLQAKSVTDLEGKIHEIELNRMADETSRAEILNSSLPNSKEIEHYIMKIDEKVQTLDLKLKNNEERTKRIENQSQRSNHETSFDRRCDQIENDLREELDRILEQIEQAKAEVKADMADEFIHFEQYDVIEQHIKHLKISNSNLSARIDGMEKNIDQGCIKDSFKDDLNQLKELSFNINKINNTFKDDVFRLENQIKENSVKLLDVENGFTLVKSEIDQKQSKMVYDAKSHSEKIEYLEELFNEMYEVIKKHNMQEKVNNLHQINHSMLYNGKESKPDLLSSS